MRISKVTTKTGDSGQTSLSSGERVSKASLRIAACGDVDELNSLLGLIREKLAQSAASETQDAEALLRRIQNHLFVMGADLTTPEAKAAGADTPAIRRMAASEVEALEQAIEGYNSKLPPLREFILPGGGEAGALLHLARTVARRAERIVVALAAAEAVNSFALVYMNRLSDLLFVLARHINRSSGAEEESARFH